MECVLECVLSAFACAGSSELVPARAAPTSGHTIEAPPGKEANAMREQCRNSSIHGEMHQIIKITHRCHDDATLRARAPRFARAAACRLSAPESSSPCVSRCSFDC